MRRSVDFCIARISRNATVPGLYLRGFGFGSGRIPELPELPELSSGPLFPLTSRGLPEATRYRSSCCRSMYYRPCVPHGFMGSTVFFTYLVLL